MCSTLLILGWNHWEHRNKRCSPTNSGNPCQGWRTWCFSFFWFDFSSIPISRRLRSCWLMLGRTRATSWKRGSGWRISREILLPWTGYFSFVTDFFRWQQYSLWSKSAYYCKHRSGTRGWTRRARECATASRATLPERTCWSRSRLLPQFEMKYTFHILGISHHIKNNQLSENARGNLLVKIQIVATIYRLSQKS